MESLELYYLYRVLSIHSFYWSLSFYPLYLHNFHDVTIEIILCGDMTQHVFVIEVHVIRSSTRHWLSLVFSTTHHFCFEVDGRVSLIQMINLVDMDTNNHSLSSETYDQFSKWIQMVIQSILLTLMHMFISFVWLHMIILT